jgi:hypothetical protein
MTIGVDRSVKVTVWSDRVTITVYQKSKTCLDCGRRIQWQASRGQTIYSRGRSKRLGRRREVP